MVTMAFSTVLASRDAGRSENGEILDNENLGREESACPLPILSLLLAPRSILGLPVCPLSPFRFPGPLDELRISCVASCPTNHPTSLSCPEQCQSREAVALDKATACLESTTLTSREKSTRPRPRSAIYPSISRGPKGLPKVIGHLSCSSSTVLLPSNDVSRSPGAISQCILHKPSLATA